MRSSRFPIERNNPPSNYYSKVVSDWICLVTSQFTRLFYCERENIAHIQSGDTLVSSTKLISGIFRKDLLPAGNRLVTNPFISLGSFKEDCAHDFKSSKAITVSPLNNQSMIE